MILIQSSGQSCSCSGQSCSGLVLRMCLLISSAIVLAPQCKFKVNGLHFDLPDWHIVPIQFVFERSVSPVFPELLCVSTKLMLTQNTFLFLLCEKTVASFKCLLLSLLLFCVLNVLSIYNINVMLHICWAMLASHLSNYFVMFLFTFDIFFVFFAQDFKPCDQPPYPVKCQ